jgi:trimeric autotransporter adhesin
MMGIHLTRMYMQKFALLLAGASLAFAQQYSITTVAGGAPPATPAPAVSTSIGQPRRATSDSAGNLYFTAGNAVYKMTSGGTLTLVAGNSRAGFSGDGGPAVNAQLNFPQGLAFDPLGNLYIADARNNRVRIITKDGLINTFAGSGQISTGGGPSNYNDNGPATAGLLHLPSGVAADKNGNIYIADTADNTIRQVTTDGIIHTYAGDSFPGFLGDAGNPINAELYGPQDVALDASGNVYVADTQNARIRQINPSTGLISTYAGGGVATTSNPKGVAANGDNGAATSTYLQAPFALAIDSSGNVYLVENAVSDIRKIDTKGIITTVGGNGTPGFSGDGSTATSAQLNFPTGIALDSSGNLFVADSVNLRVRKIASGNISTVAGNGVLNFGGDNGSALKAQINGPQGVAADAAGNVYVADTGNNEVRKIDTKGNITAVSGNGTAGSGTNQLSGPQAVAVDASGNVYIADTQNARIVKVTPGGSASTVAGSGTPGYGGDNGAATSAQIYTPTGVAVDAKGNLYIADYQNHRVRMVTPGGTISTVAGNGNQGYAGDGGPATSALLNYPAGVAVDSGGNLYIADWGNYVIRKVLPNGTIATIAGNHLPGYTGDGGLAVQAEIGSPTDVSVDASWNVYFTDASARVREIFTSGFISTIAGNGTPGYSGDGGAATFAQLNTPAGVAVDTSGNVYVADSSNNAIRKLQPMAGGLSIGSIASSASGQANLIAPGELVTLYGSGMGPAAGVSATLNSVGLYGTTLSGTTVYFNGAAAPVLYTSATQVNVVVPFEVNPNSPAQVVVNYQGQISQTLTVPTTAAAPGVFTLNGSGTGPVLAVNLADSSVNDANHPAKAGTSVLLYLTGAGQTNPPGTNGLPGAVPLPQPNFKVTATIGGQAVTPSYAGAAPGVVAGVLQVNLQIPTGLTAGAVPIQLAVGGANTQSGTTIWVANPATSTQPSAMNEPVRRR